MKFIFKINIVEEKETYINQKLPSYKVIVLSPNTKIGTDIAKKMMIATEHIKNDEISSNFEIEVDYNKAIGIVGFKKNNVIEISVAKYLVEDHLAFNYKNKEIEYDKEYILDLLKQHKYTKIVPQELEDKANEYNKKMEDESKKIIDEVAINSKIEDKTWIQKLIDRLK